MGFFEFLFAIIALTTFGSAAVAFLAGRAAWRGGKRLLGWARDRKLLEGGSGQPPAPRAAEDVVVEPADAGETVAHASGLGTAPKPGEGIKSSEATRVDAHGRTSYASVSSPPTDYVHLDVDHGCTPEQIAEVMRGYVGDTVLGERAAGVIQTLDSLKRRKQSLTAELDATFQRGSMSWDRFAGPIQAALDAVLRNAALLANRIQAFDTAGYLRLFKSVQREASGYETAGASSKAERLSLYQEMLGSLDALQETNDGLIFELDKLAGELADVQRSEEASAGSSTLDEIRRLVEEAKYYRSH